MKRLFWLCLVLPLSVFAQTRSIQRVSFSQLGAPIDGSVRYCTNCQKTTPCAAGGTGAQASRVNGVWECAGGGGASPAGSGTEFQVKSGSNLGAALISHSANGIAFNAAPTASATKAYFNFGTVDLSGGSVNGTMLGANPVSFSGDFILFQVGGVTKAKLSNTGVWTVDSIVTTGAGYFNLASQSDSTTTGDFWRNGDSLKFRDSVATRMIATLDATQTFSNKTFTAPVLGVASATSLTLTNPLTVVNGGTGLATLTANNVMLGNGTGNVLFVAPGTNGNVLTSNGTTWTSAAGGGGGSSSGGNLPFQTGNSTTLNDSTDYYLGLGHANFSALPASAGNYNYVSIPISEGCTVKAVALKIHIDGTLGSSESVQFYIRKNNSANTNIFTTTFDANPKVVSVTGLSGPSFVANDTFVIGFTAPAWVTNPTSVGYSGYVSCR